VETEVVSMKVNELNIVNGRSVRSSEQLTVSIVTIGSRPADVSATVQSVVAQTWDKFEWIICEANTSFSEIRAGNIPLSEPRITLQNALPQKAATLNRIIKDCASPFIFFLEWGDILVPTALEKMLLTLSLNPELDFVNAYAETTGENNAVIKDEFSDSEIFLKKNPHTRSFVVRSAVVNTFRFDESVSEERLYWDFWLNAASHGFWGYTIPEVLYTTGDQRHANGRIERMRSGSVFTKKYESLVVKGFPSRKLSVFNFERQVADVELSDEMSIQASQKSVLFLLPYLEVGGADKFNLDLITGLKQRNWSVTIACTLKGENSWSNAFNRQTHDIFYLDRYANDSVYFKALHHLIVTRKPSVIFVSHSMYGYYILPYIKKKFPLIPVVDYLHCEAPGWYNGGYPYISSLYQQLLDKTLASSQHLKNWCIEHGIPNGKTSVCYINIDTRQTKRNDITRKRIRNELKIADATHVLLFAGRLTDQKQPLVLLKTVEKLYKKNQNFRCIVIGDGPDKAKLLSGIRKSPARRVIQYLGQQDNQKVKEYMDAADIFFLPSAFEGIALTIYEAMAKELAIVSADVGGQSELVSPGCGQLVKRSDAETESGEYAEILLRLINDHSMLSTMKKNSRARVVNNFNIVSMIDQVEGIIDNCRRSGSQADVELAPQYLMLLNRMVFQTHVTDVLWVRSISRFNTFLKRYQKPLQIARKFYRKLKTIFSS
jgi:glycosyltransferase involved in cell wall biosynthesis